MTLQFLSNLQRFVTLTLTLQLTSKYGELTVAVGSVGFLDFAIELVAAHPPHTGG